MFVYYGHIKKNQRFTCLFYFGYPEVSNFHSKSLIPSPKPNLCLFLGEGESEILILRLKYFQAEHFRPKSCLEDFFESENVTMNQQTSPMNMNTNSTLPMMFNFYNL